MDDKQKSKEYFDGHSSTFVNRNGYWNYDYRMTSRILKKRNVKKLVDIGCGNGAFLELFHKLSPCTKLAGLDLSREMVRRFMNWWFTKWPTGDHAVYSRAEMEQMLHAAGFQNIRSRMITPFTYVSVGRKTEEKPAMIKLAGLSGEQVTEISRRIADAFFDYEYNKEDIGLIKYISTRDDMFTYMNAIVRAAYKRGVLYTTSDRQEGYLMLSGEGAGGSIGFLDGMKMIAAEKKALGGFGNMKKFISACFCDGGTIETRMRKAKRKFLRIEKPKNLCLYPASGVDDPCAGGYDPAHQ